MSRYDLRVLIASGVIITASVALVVWPPHGWQRGDAAGVTQAVSSVVAITAALLISARDRRESTREAAEERRAEREAFIRRRDYEEASQLLTIVAADRLAFAQNPSSPRRSPEATTLILTTWGHSNWWGTAVDYYVESLRDPNSHLAVQPITDATFVRMQDEIMDAVNKLDYPERV